jgi:hypothetical protein
VVEIIKPVVYIDNTSILYTPERGGMDRGNYGDI